MTSAVVTAVIGLGAAHLVAYYAERRLASGVLKAAPILLLAAMVLGTATPVDPGYARLVAAGLVLSAVGDVCLLWPHRFVHGLASFLAAHVVYIVAFAPGGGDAALGWAVVLGVFALVYVRMLWPHLRVQLRGPVAAYVTVIVTMAWMAARRAAAPGTPEPSGELALLGALSFVCSDAILARDRFARRFRGAHGWVMLTYYAAQTLIALSAVR